MPRPLTVAVLALLLLVGAAAPDDPFLAEQYGLRSIRAPAAWSVSRGAGTVVAVLDSGVDLEHPDLAPRLLRDDAGRVVGRDFVDGDGRPQDLEGHGTLVAGVAAAETGNGVGIAGVAPAARLMPVRVLDGEGRGTSADVDRAIRWAVDHGADVVNLSLESAIPLPGGLVPPAPTAAVRYAWERGVVVVAAAGNSGTPFTDYPDSSPVLIVGATDQQDQRAHFSDTGTADAVMAPGVDVVSTWCRTRDTRTCDGRTHTYARASGTSFAAAHVTGALALLRAAGLDHRGAVQRLRTTARDLGTPGPDRVTGHGLIDVAAALRVPTGASPDPSPTPPPVPPPEPPPTEGASPGPSPAVRSPAPAPPVSPAPAPAPPAPAPGPPGGLGAEAPASPAAPAASTPDAGPGPPPRAAPAGDSGGLLRGVAAVLVAGAGGTLVAVRRFGL